MGEVVNPSRSPSAERIRLIRRARAIYDSIFQPAGPLTEQQDETPPGGPNRSGNGYHSDGGSLS